MRWPRRTWKTPARLKGRERNGSVGSSPTRAGSAVAPLPGRLLAALAGSASDRTIDVVVVFGAVHSAASLDVAALDSHACWDVPGGVVELPEELERRLTETIDQPVSSVDERFHRREHAVEVELPLIQVAWPAGERAADRSAGR